MVCWGISQRCRSHDAKFFILCNLFPGFLCLAKACSHGFEAMWTSKHSFMPYRSNHENSGGLLAAGENMYFVDGHVRWIRFDDGYGTDGSFGWDWYHRWQW